MEEGQRDILECARYLASRGWAEAGAGNISIRTKQIGIHNTNAIPINYPAKPSLAIYATRSGSNFRLMAEDDVSSVVVGEDGQSIAHDFKHGKPTSELSTHLLLQSHFADKNSLAIIHAHLTNLVAATHVFRSEQELNEAVFCHTEMPLLVPGGIGLVPVITPGSVEIAQATLEKIKQGKTCVAWACHGIVAIAENLLGATNIIEAVEKACEIALKVKSAGGKTIFVEQL
ncbi:MAG TPA: class II aldolase/adducin family protein [Caldisericia bacterium]|nr:class II aldolase/adducin family protein [Caldisericia bacterium]